ncbi:hypothetical protein MRX96_053099 [Rhipicephalus microplus]
MNDTCQGPITIQLPGLQNATSCLLRQIPMDQFRQVIMGSGCQLLTILSSLAGNASLGVGLQTALTSLSTGLRLIVPTLPPWWQNDFSTSLYTVRRKPCRISTGNTYPRILYTSGVTTPNLSLT